MREVPKLLPVSSAVSVALRLVLGF